MLKIIRERFGHIVAHMYMYNTISVIAFSLFSRLLEFDSPENFRRKHAQ